ncbi:MAG: YIP1 family protein [Planctomycetales bacterium]|nr:YIP1 family protein [Planctomycetales bacterium]
MRCGSCGHLNVAGSVRCARCGSGLTRLISAKEHGPPEPPGAGGEGAPATTRKVGKVKSEILRLFAVDVKRERPAGAPAPAAPGAAPPGAAAATALPTAEPVGAGAAPPAEKKKTSTTKRLAARLVSGAVAGAKKVGKHTSKILRAVTGPVTGGAATRAGASGASRKLEPCSACQAPFVREELFEVRLKLYCEGCFRKRAELFGQDEVQDAEARRMEALRAAARATQAAAAAAAAPPPAAPGTRRNTTNRYKVQQDAFKKYVDERQQAPQATTILWPKCAYHPDHSTKDRCASCKRPICALCIIRRGDLTYCTRCEKSGATVVPLASERYEGLSTSTGEAIRDLLFYPGVYFRNLPAQGGILRPFFFALGAWALASLASFTVVGLFFSRFLNLSLDMEEIFNHAIPILVAVPLLAVANLLWSSLASAGLGQLFGGRARFAHAFRAACLSSGPVVLLAIPVLGLVAAPVFHLRASIEALREVHRLPGTSAAAVAILAFAGTVATTGILAGIVLS